MLSLFCGKLPTSDLYKKWEDLARDKNFGAVCIFCGVVRDENGISGLSFDVYEPLLRSWFDGWQEIAKSRGAILCMAHSIGDVLNGESSYMSAVLSSQRKVGLSMYGEFVEDFKQNAPIWKYDLKSGGRIYASNRSHRIKNYGILAK